MQMDGGKVDNVKVAQLLIDNGKKLENKVDVEHIDAEDVLGG